MARVLLLFWTMTTFMTDTLDRAALDAVYGGMRWEDFRQSTNVEDHRPQSQGGPVPDDEYAQQQAQLQQQYETSCDPSDPRGDGSDGSDQWNPYLGDQYGSEGLTDEQYNQGMSELSEMSESLG